MSYCDDKKLAIELSEEARKELEVNLESGIANIIEFPYDNTPSLKEQRKLATKAGEKRSLLEDIKQEKKVVIRTEKYVDDEGVEKTKKIKKKVYA